jgi:hypothetical protein
MFMISRQQRGPGSRETAVTLKNLLRMQMQIEGTSLVSQADDEMSDDWVGEISWLWQRDVGSV